MDGGKIDETVKNIGKITFNMPNKGKILLTIIYEFKLKINQIILWISIKLGLVRAIMIVPYQGFGKNNQLLVVGRVLRDNRIKKATPGDSVWKNIDKMVRRFQTIVIPNVRVKAEFQGEEFIAVTNEEGYFEFDFKIATPIQLQSRWQKVQLTLLDVVIRRQGQVSAIGEVFIPSGKIDYGIISDIDDTIIPTGAMRLTEMLKTTFSKNAYSRVPFAGVSALYQSLEKGKDGIESNPFFYVSSSPWNLYDFLLELLEVHHIPQGPLMLRDIGLSRTELISGSHEEHKLQQIRNILSLYDKLPFMLFGDSGQDDPAIYLQIVKEFPGRILIVFIRDIHPSRRAIADGIRLKMKELGVEMMLVEDTVEATKHAINQGWVLSDDLLKVAEKKQKDEVENKQA